jgi:hypothetical protein
VTKPKITKSRRVKRKSAAIATNPRKSPRFATNAEAVEATIEQLHHAGRLEKIDSATVEIARLLAAAVDASPENANLWRQYREAVLELRHVGVNDADDFEDIIEAIHRDAALRDPEKPNS